MHPGMGLRKMYEQFEPEGIGRDAFISLGLREGFRLKTMDNPQRTTISIKSNRYKNLLVEKRFTDINQLWVSDLFYFSLEGEHNYVVLIMDVYSRRILGYSISDNMRAENNINALQMALTIRGVKDYKGSLIHHSDRGSQYISNIYTDLLENYGVQISMCSDVLENAHCERVNGTIKNEYLKRWEIKTYRELQKKVKKAINNYNDRLHYSIKKTPNEYEVYLNSIPLEKREILEIFTIKKTVEDPLQIEINF
jgi:putative transposase